jgi:putative membrane protein
MVTHPILQFVQGLLIGAGAILPGISGATLAVVLGVFEEFTELIAHPKKNLKTFIGQHWTLCIGIVVGFVLFTLLLDRLFRQYTLFLVFLFVGFIAGTLPGIYRRARKHGVRTGEIISLCVTLGIFIVVAISHRTGTIAAIFPDMAQNSATHKPDPLEFLVAGAIVGAGSLLPGASASVVLIYLGIYEGLLDAFRHFDIASLALLGAGAAGTVILMSRLVSWLYERFHGIMSFTVLGFTIGTLLLVFPGFHHTREVVPGILLMLTGLATSILLDRADD